MVGGGVKVVTTLLSAAEMLRWRALILLPIRFQNRARRWVLVRVDYENTWAVILALDVTVRPRIAERHGRYRPVNQNSGAVALGELLAVGPGVRRMGMGVPRIDV